ncbi:MmpS family transport accessory protein [Saccharothrix xinjiangensis]|uniref:MmpS family transport accessory protein n=1 Tax=Saccharothrix xinjiangensis TaxID=204798 RepID=A0ABV9Y923_9PSEU
MTYPQPPQTQHQPPPPPVPPQNGLGTAGFVLGLVGLLFSFLPVIGVVAWPLVILGLVLGLVGWARADRGRATNKGLAIAGVALSAVGLVVCVLWAAVFTKAASDVSTALDDLDAQANKEAVLVYEITGDVPSASITYSTHGDGGSAMNQEEATTLPWTKELTVKGLFSGGTLSASTGAEGGTVTCRITVDGVEKKTATASGPFSMASCSNF